MKWKGVEVLELGERNLGILEVMEFGEMES
jgi:hypothetical protein